MTNQAIIRINIIAGLNKFSTVDFGTNLLYLQCLRNTYLYDKGLELFFRLRDFNEKSI